MDWLLMLVYRQSKNEVGALVFIAFIPDTTAHSLHYLTADGQPYAGA
jgi:hypothetical protein